MFRVNIERDVCKGCSLCVNFCPKKVLEIDTQKLNKNGYIPVHVVNKECIGCLNCTKMCPDSAIEIMQV